MKQLIIISSIFFMACTSEPASDVPKDAVTSQSIDAGAPTDAAAPTDTGTRSDAVTKAPNNDPPAEPPADALCGAYCRWTGECLNANVEGCTTSCKHKVGLVAPKWRNAYVNAVVACFATLTCNSDDATCTEDFASADPAYPNIPEVQQCMARRTECENVFSDERCGSIAALIDAARPDALKCLAKPCGEIGKCLGNGGP